MTRTHYRLLLVAVCTLAAWAGPVVFLEDHLRPDYLLGGLGAALLTWLLLAGAMAAQPSLHFGLVMILGAGAAVLSWAPISLVAVFDVLPHITREGFARFDPVWLLGGFAPVAVAVLAWWRAARGQQSLWESLLVALYRFSIPLFGVRVIVQSMGLPKQFRWLSLFTGVMFLVLDGVGFGPASQPDPKGNT